MEVLSDLHNLIFNSNDRVIIIIVLIQIKALRDRAY